MLNICQVSLERDIPIILENFYSFKKIYQSFRIFIICPASEINVFKKKLNYDEFKFINEGINLIKIKLIKANIVANCFLSSTKSIRKIVVITRINIDDTSRKNFGNLVNILYFC